MYEQILNNENLESLLGLDTSETSSTAKLYKVRYCLQIISSLIFEYKQQSGGEVVLYVENLKKNVAETGNPGSSSNGAVPHVQGAGEPKQNAMPVDNYDKDFPALTQDGATSPKGGLDNFGDDADELDPREPASPGGSGNGEYQKQSDNQEPLEVENANDNDKAEEELTNTAEAIPLPYHGPLLPGNEQTQTPRHDGVPLPPKSAIADIGAPNEGNTLPHHKSVDDFVGNQIRLPLTNSPAATEPELERRKQWLPQFLAQGGLSKLISLLKDLAQYHSKIERTKSTENQSSGQVDNKIAKRCLHEVMDMIKVLLVSSFCASSAN